MAQIHTTVWNEVRGMPVAVYTEKRRTPMRGYTDVGGMPVKVYTEVGRGLFDFTLKREGCL